MNYLNVHTARIESRLIIPVGRLEKGMIIEARYNPEDHDARRYMLLVLQPNWRGMVHAITLNNCSYFHFDNLAREQGTRIIPRFKRYREIIIPKLIINESSKRFYSGVLKPRLKSEFGRGYRTFFVKKFGVVSLVNYKFSTSVEDIEEGYE